MHQILDYLPVFIMLLLILLLRAGRNKEETLLSKEERERLYSGFIKHRLFQYGIVLLISVPILIVVREESILLEWKIALVSLSAVAVVFLFTVGYHFIKKRLIELEMPAEFVQAYLKDRMLMAILIAVLLGEGIYRAFFSR